MPARKSSRSPDVAIVTVSYNSSSQLADFLPGAIGAVSRPSNVVVVDNASGDIDVTVRLTNSLGVSLLRLDRNVGYGRAINAGVAALPAEISLVLISNPDSVVSADAVSTLREALLTSPDIGAVGPRIRDEEGEVYPSARAVPSLRSGVGHALFSKVWPGNPWTKRYHSDAYTRDEVTDAGWLSGACLMVRRSVFDSLGGFDPAYFMYFEDVDFGFRLGKRGLRNVYVPDAEVMHVGGVTTKSVRKEMLRAHHESAQHFLSTKYAGPLWAPVRLVLRMGLALRLRVESRGAD